MASATCLRGWGHAQRGSSGEEALVRAAWRCREVHLLGGRGWARAERGGAGWRGSGAGRLGLGAAGAGSGSAAARALAVGPTALTDPWHRGCGGRRSALSRGPVLRLPAPLQPRGGSREGGEGAPATRHRTDLAAQDPAGGAPAGSRVRLGPPLRVPRPPRDAPPRPARACAVPRSPGRTVACRGRAAFSPAAPVSVAEQNFP